MVSYRTSASFLLFASRNRAREGGNEKNPVKGQTKVQAVCTCMWNETPDDFKGNLAILAETPRGKKINKICEKNAGWHG